MEKNIETNEQVVERFVGMVIKKHPDNIYLHKSVRRLVNKIKFTDNCWLWQGKIEKNGYGRIWIDGKSVLSHRFSYATFIGDIPENYTIDHRCHNDNTDTCSGGWSCIHRRCFNPEHLEANKMKDNLLNSINNLVTVNVNKTHCHRGHEFTEDNTRVTKDGRRHCRACARIHSHESIRRRGLVDSEYKPRYNAREFAVMDITELPLQKCGLKMKKRKWEKLDV